MWNGAACTAVPDEIREEEFAVGPVLQELFNERRMCMSWCRGYFPPLPLSNCEIWSATSYVAAAPRTPSPHAHLPNASMRVIKTKTKVQAYMARAPVTSRSGKYKWKTREQRQWQGPGWRRSAWIRIKHFAIYCANDNVANSAHHHWKRYQSTAAKFTPTRPWHPSTDNLWQQRTISSSAHT